LDAPSGVAALAEGFKKNDCAGGGDIERADPAGHRNTQQMITGAADEVVEAGALAAEDDDAVAGEIELVEVSLAAFVETDDPDVLFFQLFEGADQVDDTGDAQVLGGSGAGFDGCRTERGGAALGEQDAVDSGAVGYAQQCAEILRVFNAVESEKKAGRSGDCRGKEVFDGEKLLGADEGYDALMSGSLGEFGQLLAGFLEDTDAGGAAKVDEALQALGVAFASNQNVVETPPSGLEGFLDRMKAVENIHKVKCRRWRRLLSFYQNCKCRSFDSVWLRKRAKLRSG